MSTATLGELLKRLRRAAVDGVVPEREFLQGVRVLAVDDAARERLRDELARLGLRVGDLHLHTDIDARHGEKVVWGNEKSVKSRVALARGLLARYEDAEGCVTSQAVEGVARLAGLDARETTELVAGARVRPDADGVVKGDSGLSEPSGASGEPSPEEVPAAVVAEAPGPAHGATDPADGDLAGAVAAALAVLEADRFERRPGKRLLTAEAEVGLAVLLRGGADRVAREPDEEELKALPRDDLRIRARDCLVVHNQGLVHSLARTVPEQGLEYEDLFQHGVLGLMRATRKFDPTMGNKFSTYATWWIRQSMTRAIADEGAVIRIPVHMHEQMRKVAGAERALANEGRRATDVDVAVRCDLTLQKVQEIRRLTRRTDSLDRVIGDGATLADFVGRTHVLPSVEKQVLDALHVEAALAVVDTFPERERRILVRRLGLDGDDPSTLDEIGREFGVTRERIRQIEGKTRPVFQERLREAGLTGAGLDALCEKAERAAERAAEAVRQARIARVTHAARTARARLALRRAKAERAARAAGTEPQVTVAPAPAEAVQAGEGAPVAEAPVVAGTSKSGEPVRAGEDARTETKAETETAPGAEGGRGADRAAAEESADLERALEVEVVTPAPEAVPDAMVEEAEPSAAASETEAPAEEVAPPPAAPEGDTAAAGTAQAPVAAEAAESPREEPPVRTEVREAGVAVRPQFTADWAEATALVRPPFGGEVAWLAEYALLAVGRLQLGTLLGSPAADTVVRAARQRGMLDRQVIKALEVLEGVFDTVKELRLRPEHFFERPAKALLGATPRAYLTDRPLVRGESRLAVRDALREFIDAQAERNEQASAAGEASAPRETRTGAEEAATQSSTDGVPPGDQQLTGEPAKTEPVETEPMGAEPAETGLTSVDVSTVDVAAVGVPTTEGPDAALRREYEEREARLREEYERRLAEQRESAELRLAEERRVREQRLAEVREAADRRLAQEHQAAERRLAEERRAAEQRLAAVRAAAEEEVGAWEDALFTRMDTVVLRHERRVRAEAEQRVAQLKTRHHEAYRALLRRTEHAEEAARRADGAEERIHALERSLREYREGAEARIADLESRLAEARAATTERERAAGAWVAELETRLRKAEAAVAERERAAASAREEYLQGARVRVAEVEARLREAEAAVAQQKLFVEAARRRAEEAEQQAARRIAQSEHDAWLRITELQTQLGDVQAQLAAAQEAARSRGSLRDRWRRS
ncbi:sigma-70 family RNA polymerase sigma factor [Streptomyces sp. enrichment culture]|uniref:sigma-70 family RNA polymerase sigma factor n=1 Tax=Streptomyces sp. enrichment culture TaxID=1795815 RepID=UPI003F54FBFF